MTRQRKIIFDIIENSNKHPTADQIYAIAKQQLPSISVGTVYRNLKLMSEAGEIRRLVVPEGPDHYDNMRMSHDHAVCINCGRIIDVDSAQWVHPPKEMLPGMHVVGYELIVKCVCDHCEDATPA